MCPAGETLKEDSTPSCFVPWRIQKAWEVGQEANPYNASSEGLQNNDYCLLGKIQGVWLSLKDNLK